jgi:hypothetical protein
MKQANRMVGASVIGAAMLIGLSTPPAQAAVISEGFSIFFGEDEFFEPLPPFDPGLGQLTGESILLSGTASVSFGSGPANIFVLLYEFVDQHTFGFFGNPRGIPISIDLSFPSPPGPDFDVLTTRGIEPDFNRVINTTVLRGEVKYFYTPNAIPEASSWVMLMLGFLGLGLAGWRHRRTACNV